MKSQGGIEKKDYKVKEMIHQFVQKIKNGYITIIIQDGYAIQLNSCEKIITEQCLC